MDCIMHHVGNISDESNGQVRMRIIVDMCPKQQQYERRNECERTTRFLTAALMFREARFNRTRL